MLLECKPQGGVGVGRHRQVCKKTAAAAALARPHLHLA